MADTTDKPVPDKRLAAVCGLFCPACHIYLDSNGSPERLEGLSKRFGRPVGDVRCQGCRSEVLFFFCRENCHMKGCAERRGLDFCGECADYPCAELAEFQAKYPHRLELWRSQQRIKEVGYEQWFAEMREHFSCPACGGLNSAYDQACRHCGGEPSCAFVREHAGEYARFDR